MPELVKMYDSDSYAADIGKTVGPKWLSWNWNKKVV